jgi:hypothetical protein
LHLIEKRFYILQNIFTVSVFLFNTFRTLNVDTSFKNKLYRTVKILEVACASEHYGTVMFFALSYATVCQVPYGTFVLRRRSMMLKFWPLEPRTSYSHRRLRCNFKIEKFVKIYTKKKQFLGDCRVSRHVKSTETKDDTCVLYLIPLLAD